MKWKFAGIGLLAASLLFGAGMMVQAQIDIDVEEPANDFDPGRPMDLSDLGILPVPDRDDEPADDGPPPELGIEEVEEGSGEQARPGDFILAHYRVKGEDGSVRFDSRQAERPAEFRLNTADRLANWDKAFVDMRPGGKRTLTVPPRLEVDRRLWTPPMGRTATLTYEVELLEVAPGVRKTVEEAGEGRRAEPGDLVHATFEATFKSEERGELIARSGEQPVVFALGTGRLLLGLQDGLPGVQAGERLTLKIDPRLALGRRAILGLVPSEAAAEYRLTIHRVEEGITHEIEREGAGDAVRRDQSIEAHITVKLAENEEKVFSSYDDGPPRSLTFMGTNEPVPSLFLAMRGMKPGEIRVARIPAPFAFGAVGYRDVIPPDADLLYRIELVRSDD
ncbi:MAG: FKBP-type peptidyl-prolyl cis-trans isomerase [Phycisphaeraceae bacterium]|nr:FKBP-type peptidyl-prolyl cis-trans isomerase [Phycisphaeraceae bacterium]